MLGWLRTFSSILVSGAEAQRERLTSELRALSPRLGVILNSNLTSDAHIRNVTKSAFYHLKNIARVHPFLSQANTETLVHAFITSRLDYCNALLSGLPKKAISDPFQFIQNSAACMLTRTRGRAHIILATW